MKEYSQGWEKGRTVIWWCLSSGRPEITISLHTRLLLQFDADQIADEAKVHILRGFLCLNILTF